MSPKPIYINDIHIKKFTDFYQLNLKVCVSLTNHNKMYIKTGEGTYKYFLI